MSTWTDELKEKAKEDYLAANPTSENTMDIVTQIAEDMGFTPNGVRLVLSKAGVYVAKSPAKTAKAASGTKTTGGTRVSKEAAQEELKELIEGLGKEADMDIISKLTGKAAQFFSTILKDLK